MVAGTLAVRIWQVDEPTATIAGRYDIRVEDGVGAKVYHNDQPYSLNNTDVDWLRRIEFFNRNDSETPQAIVDLAWQTKTFLGSPIGAVFSFDRQQFLTKADFQVAIPSLISGDDRPAQRRYKFSLHVGPNLFADSGEVNFGSANPVQLRAWEAHPVSNSSGPDTPVAKLLGLADGGDDRLAPALRRSDGARASFLPIQMGTGVPRYRLKLDRSIRTSVSWRLPLGRKAEGRVDPDTTEAGTELNNGPVLGQVQHESSWDAPLAVGDAADVPLRWWVGFRELSTMQAAALWNGAVVAPYTDALQTIVDPLSLSLIPTIDSVQGPDPGGWDVVCEVEDASGTASARTSENNLTRASEMRLLHVSQADSSHPLPKVDATMPSLIDHNGEAFKFAAKLSTGGAVDGTGIYAGQAGFVSLDWSEEAPQTGRGTALLRIGALDFLLAAEGVKGAEEEGKFHTEAALRTDILGAVGGYSVSVSIRGALGVLEVTPAGQDPVPDEDRAPLGRSSETDIETAVDDDLSRDTLWSIEKKFDRDPAIVFSRDPPKEDVTASGYRLVFQEETAPDEARNITVTLQQPGTSTQTPQRVVVVDREPFLLAQVTVPPFVVPPSALRGTELANWESSEAEGRKWEIAGFEDGAKIMLPPQAIGEEMEKGDHYYRPFKISGDQTNLDGSHRPIGVDDTFQPVKGGATTAQSRLVDYRFAPPTELTVRTSYFEQRYAEAPWNTRRVFGYVGQRAPGAGVDQISFELLYGLKGAISDVPSLRLAEVESRLGGIPPRIPVISPGDRGDRQPDPGSLVAKLRKAYRRHWQRWAGVSQAYRSRLGVLQLWAEGSSGELRIDDGVDYEVVDFADELATGAQLPADPIEPDPGAEGQEIRKRRFYGGAEWGFESRNVLNALRRDRKSSSGELRRPAFSALGGFGWLKASFDNDLTRIYADVQLGRASFYSIERIGRIGNLWHHAKHVIVYERTVVPSRQFRAQQPRHEGRPILRKVKEYIEILQPQRTYPDGHGSEKQRGCLLGVDFKSRIIPVDGTWGRDIGQVGWAIPLWDPNADPEVYPKPQITFMGAADPASSLQFVPGILEDPQKLVFFTDTTLSAGNVTDLWGARLDVDFCDEMVAMPAYMSANAVIDGQGLDRRLPDAPAIEGCERFTYRVNFGGRPVNLAAGRAQAMGEQSTTVNAVLETITFMRADPRPIKDVASPGPERDAEQIRSRLVAAPSAPESDGINRPRNVIAEQAGAFSQSIKGIAETALSALSGPLTAGQARDALKQAFFENSDPSHGLLADIGKQIDDAERVLKSGLAVVDGSIDDIFTAADTAVSEACNRLKEAPDRLVKRARTAFETGIAELRDTIDQALDDLNNAGELTKAQIFESIDSPIFALKSAVGGFSTGVEDILGEIDRTKAEVQSLQARVKTEIDRLVSTIDQIANETDPKLRELQRDIPRYRDQLAKYHDQALAALKRAANGRFGAAAKSALALAERVFALASSTLDLAARVATADELNALKEASQKLVSQVSQPAHDWLGAVAGLANSVQQEALPRLEALNAWPDELRTRIHTVVGGLTDLQVDKVKSAVSTELGEFFAYLFDESTGEAKKFVNAVEGPIGTLCASLHDVIPDAAKLKKQYKDLVTDFIYDKLGQLFPDGPPNFERTADEIKTYVNGTLGAWRSEIENIEDKLTQYASDVVAIRDQVVDSGLFQAGSAAIRLMRGYGEGPILPQLKFNRDRLAYVFDDAREAILTSPVAAMVNDVGQVLNGMGLRVPTQEMLDRLIPHDIGNTLVAKVGEYLAGFRCLGLFSGLKMPQIATDAIQIRQGLDKATQRAWLNADLKMPFGPATLFDLGPLTLKLLQAKLTAYSRLSVQLGQGPQQETFGELSGDWELGFGGTKLVTFARTAVSFDKSGEFKFDIKPDRIRLDKALEWLSDLLKSWSDPDSGFVLELFEENGSPRGVRALLDLPIPSLSTGAFAISGLRLTTFLALRYGTIPGSSEDDFIIEAGAALGRKTAPFSLTVFFLRGGGWLEAKALYATSSGRMAVAVTIGIVVGAAAEINLGVVYGGVSLEIGIFIEFHRSLAGGGGMSIGLMLLIRGRVMVIGIVAVGITLMLTLTYTPDNGSMIGRGYLDITIKISRFFKYSVRRNVQYQLQ